MKFILLFSLFLSSVSTQEEYIIIFVKGEATNSSTGETLKKNMVLSSTGSVKFRSADDLIVLVGSNSGKYVLKPYQNGTKNDNELVYYIKNNLLPVKARTSSRDVGSDIIEFIDANKFVVFNELMIEMSEAVNIALLVDSKYVPFRRDQGLLRLGINEPPKEKYIPVYEKIDGQHEYLTDIYINYLNKDNVMEELKAIKSALISEESIEHSVNDYLSGYFLDTFGYYPPSTLDQLIKSL